MAMQDSDFLKYGNQPISAKELAETYDRITNYVMTHYMVLTHKQLVVMKEVLDKIEDEYNSLGKKETDDSPIDGYVHRNVGRKPVYSDENAAQILALYEKGVSMRKIAEQVGCSYGRVTSVVKKDKTNKTSLHERRNANWEIYLKLCRTDNDA